MIEKAIMERSQPFEPEMVLIPAGEFLMGSDSSVDQDAFDAEQPQHTLYLPDYYLAKTPVTNAQYAAFVKATGHRQPKHWKENIFRKGGTPPKGKEDHPVIYVSWYDAAAYCNWLVEVTGKPYRLPSEAEWEKGARGNDGRIYPWGNQWDAKRCNAGTFMLLGGTTPVGVYPQGASPYGLLDMAGNVVEWTRTLRGKRLLLDFRYPYDPDDGREDPDAPDNVPRVLRGGAFYYHRKSVRCAARDWLYPDLPWLDPGFRVVVSFG